MRRRVRRAPERNVVITQWDWADPKAYLHDEISTDKRNPHVNANGLIYGSPEESRDYLPVLDPVHNTDEPGESTQYRDPDTPGQPKPLQPSPYGATKPSGTATRRSTIRCSTSAAASWYTSRIRAGDNPGILQGGIRFDFREAHAAGRAPGGSSKCTIQRRNRFR